MNVLRCDALVAEIGSTTTLVNAFDGLAHHPRFIGQGKAPTSVDRGDVLLGLNDALKDLTNTLGVEALEYGELFATSSAAGGLKMSVHGLVYDMTVRAAQAAALGAGAVVSLVTAGKMTPGDLAELTKLKPNIILIAGGTDYGERETAMHNAREIAALGLHEIPVIYAGNIQNRGEVQAIFEAAGLDISLCDNVYPRLDDLNIEPARKIIQQLFEIHIVKAPGMAHIYDMVTHPLMPTPGAVMAAARLCYEEMGNLVALDVGGATTDVHSACEETDEIARIQVQAEPLFMRTVEGDLGVFVNARHLITLIGAERLSAELGINIDAVMAEYAPIPASPVQAALAARLTQEAALRALTRHAGEIRSIFLPGGRQRIAQGKDLSGCRYLIATGGALTRLPGHRDILRALADMNLSGKWLYPKPGQMRLLVDNHYIMASLGALSRKYPAAAMQLLQASFTEDT